MCDGYHREVPIECTDLGATLCVLVFVPTRSPLHRTQIRAGLVPDGTATMTDLDTTAILAGIGSGELATIEATAFVEAC